LRSPRVGQYRATLTFYSAAADYRPRLCPAEAIGHHPTTKRRRFDVSREPSDFDLSAAWIRRAQGDLKAFMEGFAVRLEGAIPERVSVERKRDGLFSKTSHVVRVAIQLDPNLYSLALDGRQLAAWRTKVVRGVALKSEQMAVPEWLGGLSRDVQVLAEHADSARNVIHEFLMS
jgi:hypothetical protein